MNRKGISPERFAALIEKEKTYDAEKERQIRELQEKYTVKTEIALDHGLVYFIPLTEYTVEIRSGKDAWVTKLAYNPILKNLHKIE